MSATSGRVQYHPPVGSFLGGSPWAMARDIAEGHILVTERILRRMKRSELVSLRFEIDRKVRELRGLQLDLSDVNALRMRNRRIQRLNGSLQVLRNLLAQKRA